MLDPLFLAGKRCWAVVPGFVLAAWLPLATAQTLGTASAQTASVRPQATAKTAASPNKASQPTWKELSQEQQQALQPLAAHWETLSVERKRKWLALSKNYYAMSPAEQAKLHGRMREWVLLSQQQRTQARLNYAETKALTPEEKSAQWQAYQQLSPDEKRRLAAKAPPKPSGAAVAQPATQKPPPQIPGRTAPPSQPAVEVPRTSAVLIDRQTLLPRSAGAAAERPERVVRPERPERAERPDRPALGPRSQ